MNVQRAPVRRTRLPLDESAPLERPDDFQNRLRANADLTRQRGGRQLVGVLQARQRQELRGRQSELGQCDFDAAADGKLRALQDVDGANGRWSHEL